MYVDSTSDNPNQASWEEALRAFNTSLVNTVRSMGPSEFASCLDEMLSLMCLHVFPVCDYSSAVSRPRQVRIYTNILVSLCVFVYVQA